MPNKMLKWKRIEATPGSGPAVDHGSSRNRRHTSMTCKNKHADRNAATFTNQMGGSTRVTSKLRSDYYDKLHDPTRLLSATVGPTSSAEPRHTSMTCNNKHADRKMHVHLLIKWAAPPKRTRCNSISD
jgi:hypothetical protein